MKKLIITISILGAGAIIYMSMNNNKKRRRLLKDVGPFNKVADDFGGTVPGTLYKYLRYLGKEGKNKEDYEFWGYPKVCEFSESVYEGKEGNVMIILGINKTLTSNLGKKSFSYTLK